MTQGKRLSPPRIVVCCAAQPRYASRDEAWQAVGPVLARILAHVIMHEKAEQEREASRKKRPAR